jgi:serine/threonine-protein kinase
MTELPVPIGTVIAERYRVDRALGAGTMGVVAAAFHLEFEQPVAIKFVSPSALGQAEAAERFRREVRAAAKIKGEHVARVLDVGALTSGLPYMVMELLDGRTLEEELEARTFLPVPEAVDYVLQAIEALAEAHAASIVHRDLKPANLFLSRRPDRSRLIKVLDFGVSKSLAESESTLRLTRTGMIVGSPLYMSPEQIGASRTPDVRSDIWTLGAILFELVSGRTPYSANSMPDLYAKLLRDPPNPISRQGVEIPVELEAIITRCLQREPEQRFANVSELAQALLPFAPPRARVHAERARGVLFPSARAEEGKLPVNEGPAATSAEPGTNTVSSWGAEVWSEKRRAVLFGFLAVLLVVGASFALLEARLHETGKRAVPSVTRIAAASTQDLRSALPARDEPVLSITPSVPLVEPVPPSVKREVELKTAPRLARPLGARSVATPMPRASGAHPQAPAVPPEPPSGLSNFGGRE